MIGIGVNKTCTSHRHSLKHSDVDRTKDMAFQMCFKLDKEVRVRVKLVGQLTASCACTSTQVMRFLPTCLLPSIWLHRLSLAA